jgi:hypothetical protein
MRQFKFSGIVHVHDDEPRFLGLEYGSDDPIMRKCGGRNVQILG